MKGCQEVVSESSEIWDEIGRCGVYDTYERGLVGWENLQVEEYENNRVSLTFTTLGTAR